MTLAEAKEIIEELKGLYDPFSPSVKNIGSYDKERIAELHYEVTGKTFTPTSCQECYHDALRNIIIYLNKHNKMADKSKFRLRAGVIINCPTFKGGKVFTNDNLTDAVAESYLKKFPEQVEFFQELPEDFTVEGGTPDSTDEDNTQE